MKKLLTTLSILVVLAASPALAQTAADTEQVAPVAPASAQRASSAAAQTGAAISDKLLEKFFGKKVCVQIPPRLGTHLQTAQDQARRVKAQISKIPKALRSSVLKLVEQVHALPGLFGGPAPGTMHTLQGTLQSCSRSTNDN